MLSYVEKLFFQKNSSKDLLSSLNAVISTNESTRFIYVIYNPAYTYKFQLKTTLEFWDESFHYGLIVNEPLGLFCWNKHLDTDHR